LDVDDLDELPRLEIGSWLPSAGISTLLFLQEAPTNALAAAALCFVMYDDMSLAAIPSQVSSSPSAGGAALPAWSCLYFL
jgi:hypothetical protein